MRSDDKIWIARMSSLSRLKNSFKEDKLKTIELILLSLMVLSLPSIEAPKIIFLVFFVVVALFRQDVGGEETAQRAAGHDHARHLSCPASMRPALPFHAPGSSAR